MIVRRHQWRTLITKRRESVLNFHPLNTGAVLPADVERHGGASAQGLCRVGARGHQLGVRAEGGAQIQEGGHVGQDAHLLHGRVRVSSVSMDTYFYVGYVTYVVMWYLDAYRVILQCMLDYLWALLLLANLSIIA